ncbi:GPW/gp25 family protein [Billgrantia gudaonensis]|uniref:IraD/Gp25-like domain-containing protein n=1 Tax=Billgrantia gudaonensis TaxID=376427 RepID=A0A1G9DVN1_9GAMM|nr:GPW/gp25 family protein [Halomonas gudaonensis]SDK67928.1 hypothetical protein SAMN04487954_12326 [Halomonas gudaonensis]
MTGMNASTGRRLERLEHIRQSVRDILTTPIGSRVMRREYGSLLPELIDQPLSDALLLQAYAATVMALLRWEPRLRITAVRRSVSASQPGRATLEIDGQTVEGQPIRVEAPIA